MASTSEHVDFEEDKPVVYVRAGTSLIVAKPVFSHDAKCLFCCSGSVVKVISTDSGECLRELEGHKKVVTGVLLNPEIKLQIFTCGLDGEVISWDYSDGALLKKYPLYMPLHGLIAARQRKDKLSLVVLKQKSHYKPSGSQLVQYTWNSVKKAPGKISTHILVDSCQNDARTVASGCKGDILTIVTGRKLLICTKENTNKIHSLDGPGHISFTCVACHPLGHCVATGCSDGKIIFWWNYMSTKNFVKTTTHWHSLEVLDLTFTQEGSYLLSGGHECVLVKWNTTYGSNNKDFLPRLGSPLNQVACSPDNTMYATTHQDNGINIISSSFMLLHVFQGLTRAYQNSKMKESIPVGILCDPRTHSLVTNGRTGHLQFFSVHSDKQLYNLDITSINYVSSENLGKPITVTEICKAAFDQHGDWLATVEVWDDGVMSPDIQLKFWFFNSTSQKYALNTLVDPPHEKKVESVAFRPYRKASHSRSTPMAVTSSSDGKFKIWVLVDDSNICKSGKMWSCEAVGFYRDHPAGVTAFSEDGSLLAVGFSSAITLWDPDTNVLRTSLCSPHDREKVSNVVFGCQACCHMLVSMTSSHLTVWNLLTCSVQWSVALNLTILVADSKSDIMAAVSTDKDLFVFQPSNPLPIFTQSGVSEDNIIGAVFIPHFQDKGAEGRLSWQRHSQLYLFNQSQLLLTVDYKEEAKLKRKKEKMKQNLPQTPFSLFMAKTRKTGIKKRQYEKLEHTSRKQTGFIHEMLSTAAHVQPPATSLCQTFLSALLIKEGGAEEVPMDDQEESNNDKSSITVVDSDSDMEVEPKVRSSIEIKATQAKLPAIQQTVHRDISVTDENITSCLHENVKWFEGTLRS